MGEVFLRGTDGMVFVPEVYPARALRPTRVTWCARCQSIQCVRHGMRSFTASAPNADGVWVYDAPWPVHQDALEENARWVWGPSGALGDWFRVGLVNGEPPHSVSLGAQTGVLWGTDRGVHQYFVETHG